jgi:hypothetical protein
MAESVFGSAFFMSPATGLNLSVFQSDSALVLGSDPDGRKPLLWGQTPVFGVVAVGSDPGGRSCR